jgi:hypothetical protein
VHRLRRSKHQRVSPGPHRAGAGWFPYNREGGCVMLSKIHKPTLLLMILVLLYVPNAGQNSQQIQHKIGGYLHSAGISISHFTQWAGQ